MYARYKTHHDATLSCIEDTLHRCHINKDVLLLARAGKRRKSRANAQRKELVKKRKIDAEVNAEMWMPSKKRCKINT
jgi:hypothetical protein